MSGNHFGLLIFILLSMMSPLAVAYPHIISHRGASGYVPEHSLEAYQTAMDLGTHYIEPDLCLTKDGIFVALHDPLLDDTTNVEEIEIYADRKTTRIVDGEKLTGYFVNDFTLQEVKTLRLKQRLSYRTTIYNYYFTIPTINEIIDLVQLHATSINTNALSNKNIGMYFELKHPSYFNSLGFNMEEMFLGVIAAAGYPIDGSNVLNNLADVVPIVIECFDANSLKYLSTKTSIPLVYLMEAPESAESDYINTTFLGAISQFVSGLGPEKTYFGVLPLKVAQEKIELIKSYELVLHPWTFRADSGILDQFNNSFIDELRYYYFDLHMDGLFVEFPDIAREVIAAEYNASS